MAFNPLKGFSNPWAAGGNSAALNTPAISDKPGYEALQTNVFDNDKEVLGLYGLSDKNFDPKRITLPLKLLSYNSPINPYHGGDDYFYSTNENYYPSGTEGNRLKEIVEEQKLKWRKSIQKIGQSIDDVVISDNFLFWKLSKGIVGAAVVDELVEKFDNIFSTISTNNEYIDAAIQVIKRFKSNSQNDEEVALIIKEDVINNALTIDLINNLINFLSDKINYYKGDLSKISQKEFEKSTDVYKNINGKLILKKVPYYSFNNKAKLVVNAIVGGIQGVDLILNKLEIKDKYEQEVLASTFPLKVKKVTIKEKDTIYYFTNFDLVLYDDFGINANDIVDQKSSLVKFFGMESMIAMWVLHSQRGYKPFTHKITVPVDKIFSIKKAI